MKLRPLYWATVLLVVVIVAEAHATDGAERNRVTEEVVVEDRLRSGQRPPASGLKTPVPLIDVPQSLSVIGESRIEDQNFLGLGDVLRYTPGVAVSQGEGHRDAIIIRGNDTTADFFVDGVRDDVQYYRPLYSVERIEILRGANALLFGRGGGGGVINRVQKRPAFDTDFLDLTASVDSFGAYNLAFDGNLVASDRAALRLNAFYEEMNNHRDFFDGERYGFNPTVTFALTDRTRVFLSYEYLNDDRVVDRGVPSVSVANAADRPLTGFDDTFFGAPGANFTTLEAHIFRARLDHQFTDKIEGNLTVQYADYDKLYENIYPAGFDATADTVTLDGYRDPTERQNLIVQGNLVGKFETGRLGHTVLLGVEYGNQDTANARFDNVFAASADDQISIPFTDPLAVPAFAFSDRVRDRRSEVEFVSLYLQDQVAVTDWLQLVGGFRIDRFDIGVSDLIEAADGSADGNDGDLSRTDTEISKRFGLILKPLDTLSFYASYSESFLPRSGDQFLTLDLTAEATDPQRFQNIEVGSKWDITSALSATAAVFRLEKENEVTIDPTDQDVLIPLEGSTTTGAELQLVGNLTDRWQLSGGFSYLDGQVEGGGSDGNVTRQTPDYMFATWTRYDVNDRLGLGLGLTHQSAFFVTEDNAVEVPGFTRLDAAVFYRLTQNLKIALNVENLTDTDYFPDAHSNDNISTGEPINARITLRGRF